MAYQWAANAVLVAHGLFILFVLFGALAVWRWRWLLWLHLPTVGWGIYIEISGNICPLTPIENQLRQLAGQAGYEGGFIEHYLLPTIYPAGLTPQIQWLLAGVVAAVNGAAYGLLWWRSRRLQKR